MKNSLAWRFLAIIIIVALAGYVAMTYPYSLGIDLAGGTSLTYELDLHKIAESPQSNADLAAKVVQVLKDRVDPSHLGNFIWRVIGDRRIQVQMPLADKQTLAAFEAVNKAYKDMEASSIKSGPIQHAIELKGEERARAIDALAAPGDPRNALIKDLAAKSDALAAANAAKKESEDKVGPAKVPQELRDAQLAAKAAYDAANNALLSVNVDVSALKSLVSSADDPTNKAAQTDLESLLAKAAEPQRKAMQAYIDAHKHLVSLNGGGIVDPADLQRMLTVAGVLDFRITVEPSEVNGVGSPEYTAVLDSLKRDPQRPVTVNDGGKPTRAKWCQIDPKGRENFGMGGYVMGTRAGEQYILCYDDPLRSLTHNQGKDWSVTAGDPYPDPSSGQLQLPFRLDNTGARLMGDLTTENKGRQMAILLDDKAMSAPTIHGHIEDSGVITFGKNGPGTVKEAQELKKIMDAGSLPATLQKDPISVVKITPDLGQDNINAGIRSGVIALIAVVGFMMVYYTITGFFADLALGVNLLLVLSIMALLHGTFTLPGIAGLVLTLGMAVDANVLINERIREELHKGASLWMAVKQGYDKVFWTIFDANLTTSLTSIVLIEVGSEEVKGFGVTLLIGLCIHMFTALFVTRTLMMGAIKVGIIRAVDDHSLSEYLREIFTFTWLRNGHWPFMRVITVSNIDWIGKRHIFWGISALTIVAGIVVFIARGEDKYDIEFRGGTQVTLKMTKGPDLSLEQVRARVESLANYVDPSTHQKPFVDLKEARVYGEGEPKDRTFGIETTINDTSTVKVKDLFLSKLAEKFNDVLTQTPKVSVSHGELKDYQKLGKNDISKLMDAGLVVPIEANTLDKVFEKTGIKGIPPKDVSDQFQGVAILLDNIDPPQTGKEIKDRIDQTRGSNASDVRNIPSRVSVVIPVTGSNGIATDSQDVPLTRAVVVSKDEVLPYSEGSEWRDTVAATEWQINQLALARNEVFASVTSFDAVVAGQAKTAALISIALSLILIVIYVWVRFGGIRYGIGAILSLIHDAVVAVAATVLAKYAAETWLGSHLLISDFKINLTMIAAYLTVIGYSVNDTIVIFDRVRELRGKSQAGLSAKLVNDAINQCFGRTIWTTFTVFIVVLIMYIWGGAGVRGFSYAMLIGVITGAYSTLAIASPMLLATASAKDKAETKAVVRRNPFREAETSEPS